MFSLDARKRSNQSKVLFPEYELVIEPEPDENCPERSEEERLHDYTQLVRRIELTNDASSDRDLESLSKFGQESFLADKQFRKFKKRVQREPKQVCLRQ